MGFFSGLKNKTVGNLKQLTNKKYLDAVICGCILVAYADGSVSTEEKQKTIGLIQRNQALGAFDTKTITERFAFFADNMEFDINVGKKECMNTIAKIKDNKEESDMCATILCSVGMADGEFSPVEKAVVKEICNLLNLRAADYGL